jgi:gliding motility-associated-like protein
MLKRLTFFVIIFFTCIAYLPAKAQRVADFCFCDNTNPPASLLINEAGADGLAIAPSTLSDGEGIFNTEGDNFDVSIPATLFEDAQSVRMEFDVQIQESFAWLINAGNNRFRLGSTERGLWLRYYVINEADEVTEVDTGPIADAILTDGLRAKVLFTYDHELGISELFVDGILVWETSQALRTPGQTFHINADDGTINVCYNMNGSGSARPSLYEFIAYDQYCLDIPEPQVRGGTICDERTVTLVAQGADQGKYRWYDTQERLIPGEQNATMVTPVIEETTTYYVSIMDEQCESERVAVEATVNQSPPEPMVEDVIRCNPGNYTLTALGGQEGQYRWYDANDNLIAEEVVSSYTTPLLNTTTSYFVSLVSQGCERPKAEVRAIIHPVPDPPQVDDEERCGSGALTLNARGGEDGNYRWYDAEMQLLDGETNASLNLADLQASQSFYVSITNAHCESEKVEVQALVKDIPALPEVSYVEICEGNHATLEVSNEEATSYRWYDANGDLITELNETHFTTPALNTDQTYYVSAVTDACESEQVQVEVDVIVVPEAPDVEDEIRCTAGNFELQAEGGEQGNYRWYDAEGNLIESENGSSLTTPLLSNTTTYFVSLVNKGCESPRSEVKAIIYPVPEPPSVTGAERCGSGTLTLTASGGKDGDYRWYDEAMELIAGESGPSLTTAELTSSQTYHVSIGNAYCESEKVSVEATVKEIPTAPQVSTSEKCAGEYAILQANSELTTYRWYNADRELIDGEQTSSLQTDILQYSTSFFVSVVKDRCESALKEVNVVVHPIPKAPLSQQEGLCGPGEAMFSALPEAEYEYRWYTNSDHSNPVAEGEAGSFRPFVEENTTFFVSAWSGECESPRVPYEVKVYEVPQIDAGEDIFLIPDEQGSLSVRSDLASYEWFPREGLSDPYIANPVVRPEQTTLYTIKARTHDGCIIEDDILVNVVNNFPIPNAFSPNGDSLNDYWKLPLAFKYPDCVITVYNRWGKVVFHSEGYNEPWDGRLPNGQLLEGTFLYKIHLEPDQQVRTGKITIIR